MFNLVKVFFSKHELTLDMCGSICTDGAPAMLRRNSGFVVYVKNEVPHIKITHRHALAAKSLPSKLKHSLSTAISAVNFIRGRALNHRLFRALCEEVGAQHIVLLFHTEVRWLSRGRMLTRVFEMREEICQFLRKQSSNLVDDFDNRDFTIRLAYMADIFSHLNELNTSMQGSMMNIITAKEKIPALSRKLDVWIKRVEKSNFINFPLLDDIVVSRNEGMTISMEVKIHLQEMNVSLQGHFSTRDLVSKLMLDPFILNISSEIVA